VRIIWSEIAQATFVRVMAGQAGMMTVNRAVAALADDPAPPGRVRPRRRLPVRCPGYDIHPGDRRIISP
jgi:hypothetical protein